MDVRLKTLAMGLLSNVPRVWQKLNKGPNEVDALRSYGIGLKHLAFARRRLGAHPRTVVELGCGQSLDAGLVLLLLGSEHYIAVDAVDFLVRGIDADAAIDQLADWLRKRTPAPNLRGFPDLTDVLGPRGFPDALGDDELDACLEPRRVDAIKASLRDALAAGQGRSEYATIQYLAPWAGRTDALRHAADLVFSHSVMQHVVDPAAVYRALSDMLAPGGVMSHQIDYTCMGTASSWYGHWTWTERQARVIAGKRPFLINRWAHSEHLKELSAVGLDIVDEYTNAASEAAPRGRLSTDRAHLTERDLRSTGSLLVARRS